jgi:hypothetical protein
MAVVDLRRLRDARRQIGSLGYVDVAYVGIGAALFVAAWLLGRVPPVLLAVVGVVVLGVYPIWRGNLVAAFERFVTSRARARCGDPRHRGGTWTAGTRHP